MARTSNGTEAKTVRCAIYTRKSTDEGLNQEFNSLDAQREAAEAYLLSQAGEGWTCLPDRPDTPGTDPWCVNGPWIDLLHAYVNQEEPTYDKVGIAYMLMGDTPVSNTDPYATEKTTDEDWVAGLGAHLMLLVPDRSAFDNLPTDPHSGGPWIMWPNTPYAHIMIPIESYPE